MIKKIPCFIFARKGSKGLKNKNLRKINNKPLIYYTIKHAQNSNYIDDIIVSTDSEPIYKFSKKMGCKTIYPRPKKLCSDKASTEQVLLHSIKYYENNLGKIDIFGYLQITEPFRPYKI